MCLEYSQWSSWMPCKRSFSLTGKFECRSSELHAVFWRERKMMKNQVVCLLTKNRGIRHWEIIYWRAECAAVVERRGRKITFFCWIGNHPSTSSNWKPDLGSGWFLVVSSSYENGRPQDPLRSNKVLIVKSLSQVAVTKWLTSVPWSWRIEWISW